MNKERIIRYKKGMKDTTDWAKVDAISDDDMDYTDNPPTDEAFWADAKLVLPEPKKPVGLRLDHDILTWFKKQGSGYQTRINAVLRTYMERQISTAGKRRKRA